MTKGPDVWVHLSTKDVQWLAGNPGGSLNCSAKGWLVRITHDAPQEQTVESSLLGRTDG